MTSPLTLDYAQSLKQELLDFILDAEDELATALEGYSAERLAQLADSPYQGSRKMDQVVDSFAMDGTVGSQTVLDLFLENHADWPADDRALVASWQRGFMGLFVVIERSPSHGIFMNWLTEKHYRVLLSTSDEQAVARLKPEAVVQTRLLPIGDDWMLSGPAVFLGKLGKPKLAVAIGNFKKFHKEYLYGDAPELLEQAWASVEAYHHSFLDYFGTSEITLSGHQLEKQLSQFQALMAQQQLSDSGLDGNKSLEELANEAGVSQAEMTETAAAMGIDEKTTTRLLKNQKLSQMMTPKIELPQHLKNEDQVTLLIHPRWGQVVISTYQSILEELKRKSDKPDSESVLYKSLKNLEIKPFVWHQLAKQYPETFEQLLQTVLSRPQLNLEQDLGPVLLELGHLEEPDLPETASVPIHLHDLFQEAMLAVKSLKPSKPKGREKVQKKSGFG
ncbi:MAG: hypothetical protein WA902_08225 [Thermosynechococcaceae cyanobacterium]